jgi:hypothetical protein
MAREEEEEKTALTREKIHLKRNVQFKKESAASARDKRRRLAGWSICIKRFGILNRTGESSSSSPSSSILWISRGL